MSVGGPPASLNNLQLEQPFCGERSAAAITCHFADSQRSMPQINLTFILATAAVLFLTIFFGDWVGRVTFF